MIKHFVLKMSTSKHVKKLIVTTSVEFQSPISKQNDGEVEESVPQVPVAGENTQTPNGRLKTRFHFPDSQTCQICFHFRVATMIFSFQKVKPRFWTLFRGLDIFPGNGHLRDTFLYLPTIFYLKSDFEIPLSLRKFIFSHV